MSNLKQVIEESFTQYAGATLQSRALVDVRDCLKPSARQIFYCLYTDGFLPDKPFKKTLKAIGSAARMYIHGDSSCEGVIMRASQPFAMRYPLIEVEGNEGSLMCSGNWAAPRYTASRLSNFSIQLFEDINKDVVSEWRDNYDDTEQYPSVLPTKGFYNIVNGTQGIGIGAASSIPQFNIREVNRALEVLLLNPNASFDEIYCPPDFATGAILLNEEEVKQALKTGQGSACKLRSVVEWDNTERCFIVSQIPYSVYTNTICEELETIISDDLNNPGIERFNDLTGIQPLIKIYLTKKANPDKILKFLYKNTSLQSYFSINMTMLDNGRYPKVFGWKAALQAHINHEKTVYRRGFEFDLNKCKHRIHILNGMLICVANIDEVVKVIKSSASTAAAALELQKRFILDADQSKAVLDMKLSRLANLEVKKLENEKIKLEEEIARLEKILNSEELFNQELINGWREIASKFGDTRRTQIFNIENEIDEPIETKQLSASFTNKGSVFVTETSSLYSQKRNSVGSKFKLETDEYIVDNLIGNNTDTILFFTSHGNFHHMKLDQFSIGEKQYLSNFISLYPYEHIVAAAILSSQNTLPYIIFITKKGIIKKSALSDYNLKKNAGAAAIKLDDGDEIVSILFTDHDKVGISSKAGNFVIITTEDIRAIGRVARGITGVKLNDGDEVVSAHLITDACTEIVSVTQDGLIKRTSIKEFRVTQRAAKGVRLQNAESLSDFLPISSDNQDILVISSTTQLRISLKDIPLMGRMTQGIKAIKLSQNAIVKKISIL